MAGIEDIFKGNGVFSGVAIGVGVAVLLAPVLRPVLKPVAKTALKGLLMVYDQGRMALAELGEQAEDVVAEVRAEMAEGAATASEPRRTRKSEPGGARAHTEA